MRAVAGQPATIRLQVQTDGGTPEAPDAAPTVTVVAGDGTTILYANQAGTQVGSAVGSYTWPLPPQSQLDQLTATWTYTVSGVTYTYPVPVNVVARRLVTPYTLRQADTNLSTLTDDQLLFLIDAVEDKIEDILGYSPVLSGGRQLWDVLRGTLTDALYISGTVNGLPYGWGAGRMLVPGFRRAYLQPPGAVYSGSINGVALDAVKDIPFLTVIEGALAWLDYRPWISGRYQLWFTHGDPTPPGELCDAAQKLCSHAAKTNNYPDRATQVVTENATILFALPTPDRPTGIPEVDGVLIRRRLESVI